MSHRRQISADINCRVCAMCCTQAACHAGSDAGVPTRSYVAPQAAPCVRPARRGAHPRLHASMLCPSDGPRVPCSCGICTRVNVCFYVRFKTCVWSLLVRAESAAQPVAPAGSLTGTPCNTGEDSTQACLDGPSLVCRAAGHTWHALQKPTVTCENARLRLLSHFRARFTDPHVHTCMLPGG